MTTPAAAVVGSERSPASGHALRTLLNSSVAWWPILAAFGLVTVILRARLELGVWPYPTRVGSEYLNEFPYYVPTPLDPNDEYTIHWFVTASMLALALVSPIALIDQRLRGSRYASRAPRRARGLSLFVASYAALGAWLYFDPANFLMWYWD